jgi:hypothetical protein
MATWDERVRGVRNARRKQRDDDNKQFNEVWHYLNDRYDEDIEITETETQPDGRTRARRVWRGEVAFTWRVLSGRVLVGGTDGCEESFDDLEAAYDRMAEHMCDLKDRLFADSLKARAA